MAVKRYLLVPRDPIVLIDPETDEPAKKLDGDGKPVLVDPIGFNEFVRRCLFADPKFAVDYDGICARSDIAEALRHAKDGVAVLDDNDWKLLETAVKQPEHVVQSAMGAQRMRGYARWRPEVMPQFKPFLDAIVNASTKKPDPVENETAAASSPRDLG